MGNKNCEEWCEVDCAKFIHSKLDDGIRLTLHPETILVLLYKKHEHEIQRINVLQNMPDSQEKNDFTIEKRLFPSQLEFLAKLGIESNVAFLNKVIELEGEYHDLFDWSEFEEELGLQNG